MAQVVDTAAVTIMFPGAIFAMAGGAIFGVPLGCALVWVGTTVGQTLAFIVGRYEHNPAHDPCSDCGQQTACGFVGWALREGAAFSGSFGVTHSVVGVLGHTCRAMTRQSSQRCNAAINVCTTEVSLRMPTGICCGE